MAEQRDQHMTHTKTTARIHLLSGRPEILTLLLVFVTLPYLNSLDCSWHLDDVANIILNTPIHLENLSLSAIRDTFFAQPMTPGTLYRPVSCLSFALNWLWGQDDVLGYHVVNIAIHITSTLFLYLTILLLLRSPVLNNRYRTHEHFIAAYATILWAVNPMQTQAITYIIQRMASLSAMFYIIGIWCYLKARTDQLSGTKPLCFFLCCFLAYVLAVGSKENSILFPLSIFLLELFFFRESTTYETRQFSILCIICGILTFGFVFILVEPDTLFRLFNFYTERDFTLWQRLMTEARIVLWYLSLLFYPSPFRLSIDHNVQLSTSLLSPPTTIFALATITVLIVALLFLRKRYPVLSFAILFYLLNHAVESTVIPLELVFEHRNYLPSLFLFLPIAQLTLFMLVKYGDRSLIYGLTVALSTTLLLLFGLGTIERNKVWKTEISLWSDALEKAPDNARPYINLAFNYQQEGLFQEAFALCTLSLDKTSPTPWKDRLRAYSNMGNIMARIGNHEKATSFYEQALTITKANTSENYRAEIIFHKAKSQFFSGKKDSALYAMADLIKEFPNNGQFLQLYGELLVADNNLEDGLVILRRSLSNYSEKRKEHSIVLLDISLAYAKMGDIKKASFFLKAASYYDAPIIPATLCLLENSIRAKESAKANHAFQTLLSQFSWIELMARLDGKSSEQLTIPISYPLLQQYVSNWFVTDEKI